MLGFCRLPQFDISFGAMCALQDLPTENVNSRSAQGFAVFAGVGEVAPEFGSVRHVV